jgi:hypothetical protein
MSIKIYDSKNKVWLEPMSILFGKDNTIWKITACGIGEDPLTDGYYTYFEKDLIHVAITGDINFNTNLIKDIN